MIDIDTASGKINWCQTWPGNIQGARFSPFALCIERYDQCYRSSADVSTEIPPGQSWRLLQIYDASISSHLRFPCVNPGARVNWKPCWMHRHLLENIYNNSSLEQDRQFLFKPSIVKVYFYVQRKGLQNVCLIKVNDFKEYWQIYTFVCFFKP